MVTNNPTLQHAFPLPLPLPLPLQRFLGTHDMNKMSIGVYSCVTSGIVTILVLLAVCDHFPLYVVLAMENDIFI